MEFRNGSEIEMEGAEGGLFAAEMPQKAVGAKAKEAGKDPAVAMAEKSDVGTAELVESATTPLGADLVLAGAASAVLADRLGVVLR